MSIDANIELSEEDGVFDVYGFLTKMRQQRRGLVETLVSYFDPSLSHTSAVRHKIQSVYCTFPGFPDSSRSLPKRWDQGTRICNHNCIVVQQTLPPFTNTLPQSDAHSCNHFYRTGEAKHPGPSNHKQKSKTPHLLRNISSCWPPAGRPKKILTFCKTNTSSST